MRKLRVDQNQAGSIPEVDRMKSERRREVDRKFAGSELRFSQNQRYTLLKLYQFQYLSYRNRQTRLHCLKIYHFLRYKIRLKILLQMMIHLKNQTPNRLQVRLEVVLDVASV